MGSGGNNREFVDAIKKAGLFQAFRDFRRENPNTNKAAEWDLAAEQFGWSMEWVPEDGVHEPDGNFVPAEIGNDDLAGAMKFALQHMGRDASNPPENAPSEMSLAMWGMMKDAPGKSLEIFVRFIGQQKGSKAEEKQVIEDDKRKNFTRLKALEVRCPHCDKAIE